MYKRKIFISVLIVVVIGVIAYLQIVSKSTNQTPPVEEGPALVDVADRPLGVTGDEDIGSQVDAMMTDLLNEPKDELLLVGDNTEDDQIISTGETDSQIIDTEYYE